MKSLVITQDAFVSVCHPEFPLADILAGAAPEAFQNAYILPGDSSVVIATKAALEDSKLLVIGPGTSGFFEKLPADERLTAFERCVRVALRSLDKKIALNPNWMPYRHNNRTSIFATSNTDLRILAEVNYQGSNNTYVYDVMQSSLVQDLSKSVPLAEPYNAALQELPRSLANRVSNKVDESAAIELDHLVDRSPGKGFSFDEWLPLLSSEQRNFVERPVVGPLRVRGDAGTGKTLAMVMKALKIAKDAGDDPKKILFLTHSWAMASQIDEMIRSIGRDIPTASLIEVYPLLEVSSQRDYSAIGRSPLGLDSDSGKRLTLKMVEALIDQFRDGDWVAYRGGCSPDFVKAFEADAASAARRNMSWEILVEFGCVLAAQGLLGRSTDRERYMRVRRVGYMMPLSTPSDKEVIFRLWSMFLDQLAHDGRIATDQIISDHLNELQTFYWEARRGRDGYDFIFVDEMHLFNAQERLIFHNLLADGDSVPRVIMALDPKQSPREVFTEISDDRDTHARSIYERARLPNPDKVDFVKVYRYTAEIAALAKAVLDAVPALDMDDDWNLPGGGSVIGSGAVPTYYLERDKLSVFRRGVAVAREQQVEARRNGSQVAILCMDFENFADYSKAAGGQHSTEMFVIKSRDDIEQLRYMNRRIVFSAPEYVAGLQFDSVVLLDVNGDLVPSTSYKGHLERRFLSELYLGISRAQRNVIIIASREGDGISPYLKVAEDAGKIVRAL